MLHSAIIGVGMYVPNLRIRIAEIAKHHGQDAVNVEKGLGVIEKTVPGSDEDSFTMAYEASKQALEVAKIHPSKITAVFVGSESHPYAVKPTSGMLASALEVDPFCYCADLEFACKAGTAGIQIIDGFICSQKVRCGLAVGTDTAQARPGDALEYTAAAGAAAIVLGSEKEPKALCRIDHTLSFTTDTPDFWRASNEPFPSHAGRFTGEPGYFRHVEEAIKGILQISKKKTADIDHVVLHMPNVKFPSKIAKTFGFSKGQMEQGLIVSSIGNTYSACSLLGLVNILQHAKKDETILLVSYGSGAGSDAFLLTMLRDGVMLPADEREIQYLSYGEYVAKANVAM